MSTETKRQPAWRRWPAVAAAAVAVLVTSVAVALHVAEATYFESACQSNLHQIGLGILLYTNGHGGRYPDTLGEVLATEEISATAFVCPASADEAATGPTTRATAAALSAGGHCSYVYVGRGLNAATVAATTVVAYEPVANHGDGGNVLYGDGHAEWVPAGPLAKLAATTR